MRGGDNMQAGRQHWGCCRCWCLVLGVGAGVGTDVSPVVLCCVVLWDQSQGHRSHAHRLLIISSNHMPLCSIHTMMRPLSSLVVSFWNASFQHVTTTLPLCPSRVWFRDRLFCGGAGPLPPVAFSDLEGSLPTKPSRRKTCQVACHGSGSHLWKWKSGQQAQLVDEHSTEAVLAVKGPVQIPCCLPGPSKPVHPHIHLE